MKQSQADRLYNLLRDGKPHRTDEIQLVVYGDDHLGLARIGARIFDIKKKYGVTIRGWHDPDKESLYWYQIVSLAPVLLPQPEKPEPATVGQAALFDPKTSPKPFIWGV